MFFIEHISLNPSNWTKRKRMRAFLFSLSLVFFVQTANAGFIADCINALVRKKHKQVTELYLPQEVPNTFSAERITSKTRTEILNTRKNFKEEDLEAFDRFYSKLKYESQFWFFATKVVSKKNLEFLDRHFDKFKYPFTPDALESLLKKLPANETTLRYALSIKNYYQLHAMIPLINVEGMNLGHLFDVVLPRVRGQAQIALFEKLITQNRATDPALLELVLNVQSIPQFKAFDIALKEKLDTPDMIKAIPHLVKENESYFQWMGEAQQRQRPKIDLKNTSKSLDISKNKNPDFWIDIDGALESQKGLKRILGSCRGVDKKIYYPWKIDFFDADDKKVSQSCKENIKNKIQFTYDVFAEQAKGRKHFNDGFIRELEEEDDLLNFEKLLTYTFKNTTNDQIGFFSLYQGFNKEVSKHVDMPFVRKLPSLRTTFQKWVENQNVDQIFEVRRLAIHPNATQLDVTTIIKCIIAQADSFTGKTYVVAHTDAVGKRLFESKAVGMTVLYNPLPDDYVLFIDVAQWKQMYGF